MKSKILAAAMLFAATLSFGAGAADVPAEAWRAVDPENLLLLDTRYGEVAIELAPEFAPNAVARMRALARGHALDGASFYRVIDGFVAQGGLEELTAAQKALWPDLPSEFERDVVGMTLSDIPQSREGPCPLFQDKPFLPAVKLCYLQ